MKLRRGVALAGAAAGVAAGIAAERVAIRRRRSSDPEAEAAFGSRRGERSRTVDLDDGARLFVEEVGPPARRGAVFVHGSGLRTDLWYYQMPGLGGHRLVFYDLRGHGLSRPGGSEPFTIKTMARDVLAVIEEARLDEVVLVGHSVGGMVVLELAMSHPEMVGDRVKGLVLAHATYGPGAETVMAGAYVARLERLARRPLDALGKQHERIERLRRVIRPSDAIFWAVALGAFGPRASARQVDFLYDMLAETPVEIWFDLLRCYRDFYTDGRLGDVNVPALVIGGTHDRITVPRASKHLAEHLPKAELVILDGCGHMSMLERHETFNDLVTRFLDDVLGPPDGGRAPQAASAPRRGRTR